MSFLHNYSSLVRGKNHVCSRAGMEEEAVRNPTYQVSPVFRHHSSSAHSNPPPFSTPQLLSLLQLLSKEESTTICQN
jgi:hypothetical protein